MALIGIGETAAFFGNNNWMRGLSNCWVWPIWFFRALHRRFSIKSGSATT